MHYKDIHRRLDDGLCVQLLLSNFFLFYLTINEKRNWYDIKYKHNLLYT